MGNFNRDNRSGGDRGGNRFGKRDFGGRNFGGDRKFGDRKFGGGFGKPQMHDAICSQCGKPCQVPFRPTGDREVFCSNCFKDKKHDGPRPDRNSFDRPSFDRKPNFEKRPEAGNGNNQQFKQQLEMLNAKLDKVLDALTSRAVEVKAEEKPKAEAKKTKSAVKKMATKKKK